MMSFGTVLRQLRKATYYRATNRPLSQTQFADKLRQQSGIEYTYGTISQWERGKISIGTNSRYLLINIIKVLVKFKGIHSLESANNLLRAAEYRPLTHQEAIEVSPLWINETPTTYILPPIKIQQAGLPARIKLIGRDEAKRAVATSLEKGEYRAHFIVARGGVGKSALASAIAWEHSETNQFDSILWLPFNPSDTMTPDEMFASLTLELGGWAISEGLEHSNSNARAAQIRSVFNKLKYLIVIDGVESAKHTDYLSQHLWELAGNSRFIVTSRAYPRNAQACYICEIDELDIAQAGDLLHNHAQNSTRTANNRLETASIQKIFDQIGGHPLTLLILPELLTRFSLNQILERIERGKYGAHHQIYDAVWQTLSSEARQLLFTLCFVNHSGIGEDFLTAVTDLHKDAQMDALEELSRYNLLQTRGSVESKLYNLHNLTIQFVQILLQSNRLDMPNKGLLALAVFNYCIRDIASKNNSRLPISYLIHTQHIYRFSFFIESTPNLFKSQAVLITNILPSIDSHGVWYEWVPLLQSLVRHSPGDALAERCQILRQLGKLQRSIKDHSNALSTQIKAKQIASKLNDNLQLALVDYQLAIIYFHLNDYPNAISLSDNALEAFDNLGMRYEYAIALDLRGMIASEASQFTIAERLLKQSITIFRQGHHFEDLLRTLNELAVVYERQGLVEHVVDVYEQLQNILHSHPSFVQEVRLALSKGVFHFQQEQFDKAEKAFSSIDLKRLLDVHNYHLAASTLNNLSNIHLLQNKLDQAYHDIVESIALWERLDEPVELANSFETLGDVYAKQGDSQKAIDCYTRALKMLEKLPRTFQVTTLRVSLESRLSTIE